MRPQLQGLVLPLSLALVPAILEPDFHLRGRELQTAGEVLALGRGQVPLLLEPALQLEDLSLREEHPRLPAAARLRPLAFLVRLTVCRRF